MTLESVFNRTKEVVEAAGRKACDLTDLAKLKLDLAENEKSTQVALAALGRLVYDHRKGGAEQTDMEQDLMAHIDELLAEAETLQATIDDNRGCITCRECGKSNPKTATYCNSCGKEL